MVKKKLSRKGVSLEEIYGKKKAKKIKETMCLTWEEKYGKDRADKRKYNESIKKKGKTFEEQFGKEKAKEIKKKLRVPKKKGFGEKIGKFNTGRSWEKRYGKEKADMLKKQKRELQKGKTFEERFGKEKAKMIKEKITISKKVIIEKFQYTYDKLDGFFKGEWNDIMFCHSQTVVNKFGSLDALADAAERKFKVPQTGRFGKNETQILDIIEKDNNIFLERQSLIKSDNKKYFVDGYDRKHNVVYEIDEGHHRTIMTQDFIRDNNIKNKLKCDIIRIDERVFMNNIKHSSLKKFGVKENE